MGDMQAELLALREQQRRARQPGPDVRVPNHQDASRDVDSHIYTSMDLCNIYGNVKSSRPKTLDETIELANDLMDQKLRTYAERQTDHKRKADDSSRNNHGHQQQPFKRQNVANSQGESCFECGASGHLKRDCPKLKNKDGGKEMGLTRWVMRWAMQRDKRNASRDPVLQCVHGSRVTWRKDCQIFYGITIRKKDEDKSKGKQLKDVPIIQDFSEVFLEDLPGLP
ncbi:putative reverse transcriptase domain-containing protein [Tanacetum coccineum]